jgi:hypothetical protein
MELHAAVGVVPDSIEHVDDRSDFDVERGLLVHFAPDGGGQRFADVDGASGQAPLALERLVRPFDDQHAATVDDHGTHADNRPFRIAPQVWRSPMTLTTTLFFRCPSNSA